MLLVETIFLLIGAHFLADFSLQTEYMSKFKNPGTRNSDHPWWIIMAAHCSVHALFVGVITGSLILGLIEFILHFTYDYLKCKERLSYLEDQSLHVFTKILFGISIHLA
jgi:hypothetical protein